MPALTPHFNLCRALEADCKGICRAALSGMIYYLLAIAPSFCVAAFSPAAFLRVTLSFLTCVKWFRLGLSLICHVYCILRNLHHFFHQVMSTITKVDGETTLVGAVVGGTYR